MAIESYHAALHWIAAHPGWSNLLIFTTALTESLVIVGMIVPGAMLMFAFGALIALGHLDFWTTCGWAMAGAVMGDGLSFWLGRIFHDRLRQVWPFSRHPEMLTRSEAFFYRHGGKSVLLGRFFGPVRAVIPTVAGMLDMPTGRFLVVNVISATFWAPAYLLPGMAFAASLELASQVAWRLVVLIVLCIALLWLTVWLVRTLFRFLHPRVYDWLTRYYFWSLERPLLGAVSLSLLDPGEREFRGLTILAILVMGIAVLANLLLDASGQHLPSALDQSLYYFLQDLRNPWADKLLVLITQLGDTPVKATLAITVFGWLFWHKAFSAALHWLTVLLFGLVTVTLCHWLFVVQRPMEIEQGIASYSFPSNHAASGTVLFGFLAVLIARQTEPERRWIPYLTAALIVVPIAFSRLYLGVQWFTDVMAGMALGLIWVVVVGAAYNRRSTLAIRNRGLILVCLAAVLLSTLVHAGLHHREDLYRYRIRPTIQTMNQEFWWQTGWQELPPHRIDFRGNQQQPFVLQWAAPRRELERRLEQAGWQKPPSLELAHGLRWLNPQARLIDLPVLPRLHDGRHEDLTLVQGGADATTRQVLRFWNSGIRLRNGSDRALWLGSLTSQTLERRMNFFSIAVSVPGPEPPKPLLAPVLQGLRTRSVADNVLLIIE